MNRAPDLNEVQELLSQAQEACLTYQQRHPAVQNLSKLVRRIEKELQNVQQMMQDHSLVLKPGRLQVRFRAAISRLKFLQYICSTSAVTNCSFALNHLADCVLCALITQQER